MQTAQKPRRTAAERATITRLARAIRGAAANRSAFTLQDGLQAGLTEAEVHEFYDAALIEALAAEPALADMAAQ